jgi:hypothetical protein
MSEPDASPRRVTLTGQILDVRPYAVLFIPLRGDGLGSGYRWIPRREIVDGDTVGRGGLRDIEVSRAWWLENMV